MPKVGVEKKEAVGNGVKRLAFTGLSVLFQIIFIVFIVLKLSRYFVWIVLLSDIISLLFSLLIYSASSNSTIKIPWIILILTFPILGLTLFVTIGLGIYTSGKRKVFLDVDERLLPLLKTESTALDNFTKTDKLKSGISRFIEKVCGYPVYENTDVIYFDDAYPAIEAQKEELKKAEEFIFMEYHAIEDKETWQGIEEILAERVREGVEVRVFYDDVGSIGFIDTYFVKKLEDLGIQCTVFNKASPGVNFLLNNRDHRKITVIDGKVGFVGGYNLANEYVNIDSPYGHWKDTGICIKGEAVKSLSITFLQMWDAVNQTKEAEKAAQKYIKEFSAKAKKDSFVQPYADTPADNIRTGEDVYIGIAETALDYAWFISPYLILTDEMIHAFGMAAKRGVDVRVITPGIPDKKSVYQITRSYYNSLVRNGVRIFEYTPGFSHCKMAVSDDKIAVCGTINLDYRSFYHNFENACLYYGNKAVLDTKEDFDNTLATCVEVSDKYLKNDKMISLGQMILKLFAPLM